MREFKREYPAQPPLRVIEAALPHNEQAEASVLASLVAMPEQIETLADILKPDDFYVNLHRILYEIMYTYYREHGKGADMLVLFHLLDEREDIDGSDLIAIKQLGDQLWSSDLMQDTRLILGTAYQRRGDAASDKLKQLSYLTSDPDKLREGFEKILYDLTLSHAPVSDFESIEDILTQCAEEDNQAAKTRGQITGIPTGFTDIDRIYNGFQRSDLILLAGRPGFGKTSLGMGMARGAAKRGFAVAVFSLEMGKKQLGRRLVSIESGIPTNHIRAGWLEDEDWVEYARARDRLSELPLYIDDTMGSPIHSMRSKLRRLKAKIHRDIDFVVVDYLQLMEDESESAAKRENRNQELSKISRGMKQLAREFNIPILALAQLSRDVEKRQSKIPQLSDLRDSGSLEQDADIVMFVYRDEMYDKESDRHGMADIIVAKHRNGPVGEVTLRFNPALTRFDNLETTIGEE